MELIETLPKQEWTAESAMPRQKTQAELSSEGMGLLEVARRLLGELRAIALPG
jgi:hypothetical protein